MNNQFTLRKAERKQAKLRIGLFGPSGAGKTMSALKLARGITEWNKIAVIDTENNSADLYSHLGEYNVMNVDAPFTPEKYIQAIQACEQAGMEVIIIDSITHEWAGTGGILEIADELSKAIKNGMQVWAKLTPRHNRFIQAVLSANAHVICCGRTKQDYAMNQIERNGRTISVPEKVGLKAITREGFDYEMTIAFDIAINHYAKASKDRTDQFMMEPEFKISEETGKKMVAWNESGVVDPKEKMKEICRQLNRLGLPIKEETLPGDILDLTGVPLRQSNFDAIINKLKSLDELPKSENTEQIDIDDDDTPEGGAPVDENPTFEEEHIPEPPQEASEKPPVAQEQTETPKTDNEPKPEEKAPTEPQETEKEAPSTPFDEKVKAGLKKKVEKLQEKIEFTTHILRAYNKIIARAETGDESITNLELQFVDDIDSGKFKGERWYKEVLENPKNQ